MAKALQKCSQRTIILVALTLPLLWVCNGALSENITCVEPADGISSLGSKSLTTICTESCDINNLTTAIDNIHDKLSKNAGIAFLLVCLAGLSTGIGALMAFFKCIVNQHNKKVFAIALGFSGGVMLFLSFTDIFFKSEQAFIACDCLWASDDPAGPARIMAIGMFFAGVLVFKLLDILVHYVLPSAILGRKGQILSVKPIKACQLHANMESSSTSDRFNPASDDLENNDSVLIETPRTINIDGTGPDNAVPETRDRTHHPNASTRESACTIESARATDKDILETNINGSASKSLEENQSKDLMSMSLLTALAITLHNIPEGLATFVGVVSDPIAGATLAIAIALHNIPEGLCVALPIYYATKSRWKGFLLAVLSGVAEIFGGAIGYIILRYGSSLNDMIYGIMFGIVAGLMVSIVVCELIPSALSYDPAGNVTSLSSLIGMAVVALSLILFLI